MVCFCFSEFCDKAGRGLFAPVVRTAKRFLERLLNKGQPSTTGGSSPAPQASLETTPLVSTQDKKLSLPEMAVMIAVAPASFVVTTAYTALLLGYGFAALGVSIFSAFIGGCEVFGDIWEHF